MAGSPDPTRESDADGLEATCVDTLRLIAVVDAQREERFDWVIRSGLVCLGADDAGRQCGRQWFNSRTVVSDAGMQSDDVTVVVLRRCA